MGGRGITGEARGGGVSSQEEWREERARPGWHDCAYSSGRRGYRAVNPLGIRALARGHVMRTMSEVLPLARRVLAQV